MKRCTPSQPVRNFTKTVCAILSGTALMHVQSVQAGWSGIMNGAGYGWASANVTHSPYFNTKNSGNMQNPSVAIPLGLPPGASSSTFARASGRPGYIWSASTQVYYGDTADNPELEQELAERELDLGDPTRSAALEMESFFDAGRLTVTTFGTAGTALWLRGFEYDGDMDALPHDDLNTPGNETIAYLLEHGATQRFDSLLVGPFSYGGEDSDPLVIECIGCSPVTFSIDSNVINNNGDPNLIFFTDGLAKSFPLPDSGSTLAFLAMGLIGLGVIQRRK